MLFHHQEEKQITLYAGKESCFEIKKKLVSKNGSKALYDLAQSWTWKVCSQYGRYSVEVQVQFLFNDQTESWMRIVKGIDKFVRETMPVQEEGWASVKPAVKARPILKPSSNKWLGLHFHGTETMWIFIEIQEFKDPPCFQVLEFITRLLRNI